MIGKIRVVAIGKIPHYLKQVQERYLKLMNFLELIEVKESKIEKLGSYKKGFSIILDEKGKELDSVEFAKLINGKSFVTFFIGNDKGLPENFKTSGDFLLSLSKMTLQHDIARIVLLEQIYRAWNIIRGSPYHK